VGVTIPAFIQKRQNALSIYHATLVLNFATFSSIVSLAVAPMCTIWRQPSTLAAEIPQEDRESNEAQRLLEQEPSSPVTAISPEEREDREAQYPSRLEEDSSRPTADISREDLENREVERLSEEEGHLSPAANPRTLTNLPRRRVHHQRLILSLALLMQVRSYHYLFLIHEN